MSSIKLDIHESVNELISRDGNYIDLLSCDEYTLWYLLRQLNIQSFLPVIHTNCFLTKDSLEDINIIKNFRYENFDWLLFNFRRFFNIMPIEYCASKSKLNDFIKEGIGKNQFIYMRYDSYYDSLQNDKTDHYFHAYPIAGYDDTKGMYYSIFEGQQEVRYNDLENIHIETSKFFKRNCFYFDTNNIVLDSLIPMSQLWGEIYSDLECAAKTWKREIAIFRGYHKQLDQVLDRNDSDKESYVLEQRLIFNELIEGIHGNFIFRLNLINKLFHIDTSNLKELFLDNRKKFKMLANMFRKASIFAKVDSAQFSKIMVRIKEETARYCIDQSNEMLHIYLDILRRIRMKMSEASNTLMEYQI